MSLDGEVTQLLQQLQDGNPAAAQELWQRYFARLVGLARHRLRGAARRVADEEDVALSAFDSFCRAAEQGRFPRLADRDDLWQVLVMITVRKAIDLVKHEGRLKIGGGQVIESSDFAQVISRDPDPALAAEVTENCQRLLDALGDDVLRAVALAKMEGHTNAQIAAKFGVSLSTIELKLAGCRAILRECLAK